MRVCAHACVCFYLGFSLNDVVALWVLEMHVEICTGHCVKRPLCFGTL